MGPNQVVLAHVRHGRARAKVMTETTSMRSCDQIAEELSDALDGALPLWRRLQIRLHLALCPPCARMRRSLERTVDLLHALRDDPGTGSGGPKPQNR